MEISGLGNVRWKNSSEELRFGQELLLLNLLDSVDHKLRGPVWFVLHSAMQTPKLLTGNTYLYSVFCLISKSLKQESGTNLGVLCQPLI